MTGVVKLSPVCGIAPVDRAGVDVASRERNLHHDAGLGVQGQEGRIGRRALLAKRRQHDLHHRVIAREQAQERLVEAARAVVMGRGGEFIVEAEGVEKGAKPRIVVRPEALMRPERVRDLCERLPEMLSDELFVGDVVGDLAQPVHVVGEGDELRRDLAFGQNLEGAAHHRGARHFSESADMRQARGAVARFEQHVLLPRGPDALDELPRLLEGPGGRDARGLNELGRKGGGFGERGHRLLLRGTGGHSRNAAAPRQRRRARRPKGRRHRLRAKLFGFLAAQRLDQAPLWLHSLMQHAQYDEFVLPSGTLRELVEDDVRGAAPAAGGVLQVVEANALSDPTGVHACRALWICCHPLDSKGDNPRIFFHLSFAEQARPWF